MTERLRVWFRNSSLTSRILAGAAGLLFVALFAVAILQSSRAASLRADLGATEAEIGERADEAETLTADLAAAEQQLATADQRVIELEETIAAQEMALVDAAAFAETLQREASDDLSEVSDDLSEASDDLTEASDDLSEASDDLSEAQRLLADALADREQAERLVAELTLAYSDDIDVARATLASSATAFACEWGTGQATDSKTLNSVTGQAALASFAASDEFRGLVEESEIATALSVAETLGEDLYGVGPDEVGAIAVGCWQTEDAKLNAALYQHQGVLREAVLDAACTSGASEAYEDRGGYWWTTVYLNWELTVGRDDARAYEESVKDRFGSIKVFLAIPDADIQAESARCDNIRNLIEPKRDGTWNVGDEIAPGTWKAYDVSDCYWARLAENGNIRADHFGDGLRLTVNVSPSDGQFEISGCVFFYANP